MPVIRQPDHCFVYHVLFSHDDRLVTSTESGENGNFLEGDVVDEQDSLLFTEEALSLRYLVFPA